MSKELDLFEEAYSKRGEISSWTQILKGKSSLYIRLGYVKRNFYISLFVPENSKLLDLGCGVGDLSNLLSIKTPNIISIDPIPSNLSNCRRNLMKGSQYLVQGRSEYLPFRDNSFDTILMADVIEHVESIWDTLGEVKRILKPGGRVIITTPNKSVDRFWQLLDKPVRWFLTKIFKKKKVTIFKDEPLTVKQMKKYTTPLFWVNLHRTVEFYPRTFWFDRTLARVHFLRHFWFRLFNRIEKTELFNNRQLLILIK